MSDSKKCRPLLTPEQQIQHLKTKGVKFEYISEEDALEYLIENNNYFKLRSYRKNFQKRQGGEKDGQYIDLDFAMLKDLAIIDMRLRYLLIQLALDIEHFEKVKLLRMIAERTDDGYEIVREYLKKLKDEEDDESNERKGYTLLMAEIARNRNSSYCSGLIDKYDGDYPVWVFVEIITFGSFIYFLSFAADYLESKELREDFYLLKAVKSLRNTSAHNNCILNNLSLNTGRYNPNHLVVRAISHAGVSKSTRNARMSNAVTRDIATLLCAHKRIVTSSGVIKHRGKFLHEWLERCTKTKHFYDKNSVIPATFDFLTKIVDKWYPM